MADEFIKKYKQAIKHAKNSKEIEEVLNKVYEDGFADGSNESEN